MSNYAVRIPQVTCWEDAGLTILARIRGNLGAYITQASFTGILYRVYKLSTGLLVTSGSLTVSATVFDALQDNDDDPRWTADAVGFNFRYTIPAAAFPDGNQRYRVEIIFDPTSGDDFPLVFEAFARNLMGS